VARDPKTSKRRLARSKTAPPPASPERSAEKLKKLRQAAERQIDEFMRKVGCSNPSERTDQLGWRWFEYRSVRGRAGIVESEADGEIYLRAESLVGGLPSNKDQALNFMRELLEMNMTIPGFARLGIGEEGVFVCATIPVVELAADEVHDHIHSVMAIAASFDNPSADRLKHEGASQEDVSSEPVPDPSLQAE
jgi:hypothetical protein